MKIFFLRHQMAGVLWEFPFADRPTEEQLTPLHEMLVRRHGQASPKDGKPLWSRVIEVDVIARDEVISLEAPGVSTSEGMGAVPFEISAVGKVT